MRTYAIFAKRPLNMSGGQKESPRGWLADTGKEGRYEDAAGALKLPHVYGSAKRRKYFLVIPWDGGDPFVIEVKGRNAWAVERLIAAGQKGCTPMDQPAPRWSSYVHQLRELGVPIETIWERHGGPYAGTHGRYVLRAAVCPEGGAV